MNPHPLHIDPYNLAFLGTIFIGLTFSLQLFFTRSPNQKANRFLSLTLAAMALWVAPVLGLDSRFSFSLAFGPLIYLYVLQITGSDFKFTWKNSWHFVPVLLQQETPFLTLISLLVYLFFAQQLIGRYYQQQKFIRGERYRKEFRWLSRLVAGITLSWFLLTACSFAGHLLYAAELLVAVMFILLAVTAYFRPKAPVNNEAPPLSDQLERGSWLKQTIKENRYYEDPELSLASLAGKLGLSPHDLSRLINTTFKKSFTDLINAYRVADVIRKMKNPSYDWLTLPGIAYGSGFNSERTFHRAFKEITGKTPAAYKKELPSYKLAKDSGFAAVVSYRKYNRYQMFKNYLKIAWRNLVRNKTLSLINIGGLAVGMAVAILIGLWIWDELSFDKYHQNYDHIAIAMESNTVNGTVNTNGVISLPLDAALRKNYGAYFKYIVLSAWDEQHILNFGDKNISFTGNFMSPDAPKMFTLHMLAGNRDGLKDRSSVFLSASTAKTLFGRIDIVGKVVRMDNKEIFKISGVYEDLPENTTLHNLAFIGSFDHYINAPGNGRSPTDWGDNSLILYVQLADNADLAAVSAKIKDIKLNNMDPEDRKYKPVIFLQPMRKWHLYAEFKDGVNTGGAIQNVWMFGTIGFFVLLLACINFMNLSTARSEKRAKEVGIRKAVGSVKSQLVKQFYWESFLIALLSFVIAVAMVWLTLPWFDEVAGKQITMPFGKMLFWIAGLGFTFFTGMIAGSYPALYLSSFNPVKVLKGTFKVGQAAVMPRKILVVMQFSVSVIMIIGTIIVFKQVQFAKDRPVGYSRAGLVDVEMTNDDMYRQFAAVRADLLASNAVTAIAGSSSNTAGVNNNRGDINWTGRDPAQADFFGSIRITPDYGKTVGWQFTAGRDFVLGRVSDSLSVVLNEAAVSYMGLKHPLGETIKVGKRDLTVIGVVKNMVMESPYEPVKQTIYYMGPGPTAHVLIRINPAVSAHRALDKIAAVCKTYSPSVPFAYRFADDEYAKKFTTEVRIGKLASAFALLAIFISCLGLFGMASFAAEQRVKELGVRKVLGASVFGLWRLLSKDFMVLIGIALLIAMPLAYAVMHNWLEHYPFHTDLSWWVFAGTAAGAVLVTLLTISYQGIKAALINPVRSLRSE